MTTPKPLTIRSRPGIKRDGTRFDGDFYTDGVWTRFQRGLPRKMGGYTSITGRLDEKVYGMGSFSANMNQYVHLGMGSKLMQAVIGNNGVMSSLNDRTPAGFAIDSDNSWQISNFPSSVSSATDIIAHASPDLQDIADQTETDIYFGQADLATALVATGLDPVSGGACAVGPYVFGYGNAGFIQWSAPNDPSTPSTVAAARVTGQKIVYGRELRGGGGGPSGIFWSLDSVIRATFNADPDVEFSFDTLATEMSLLSAKAIVEYNGVFYWWDTSGPQQFNGVVREVPNDLNLNFLLDNINMQYRQKMFVMKTPRYGEIMWCVPLFGATECNWAIILNVRENTWYDTPLPDSGRTSGIYASVYPKPFMTDADQTDTGYTLWQHETGTDKIQGSNVEPVPAQFTTADMSIIDKEDAVDKALRVAVIEPDFVQSGEMFCVVSGRANSRSPDVDGETKTFPEDTGDLEAADQVVRLSENRREMNVTFGSNTPGGDYQMGKVIGHLEPTDGRFTQ